MSEHGTLSNRVDESAKASRVRHARRAVTAAFMAHAMLFASWTAHIPQIKSDLGISNATLGTALLGAPLGSVTAMVISRWLLPRVGSQRMIQITVVGYALAGISVGVVSSVVQLFAALAVWGLFQGGLDVAMNTQGVTVEKALGSPIMSRLHGMWSVGGLTGALVGAGAVTIGVGLSVQLLVMGVIALTVVEALSRSLLDDQASTEERGSTTAVDGPGRQASVSVAVAVLGGVSFASMLCEGAAADWSANYLRSELGATAGLAGLGYAGYTAMMVVMRLSGTSLQARFPARRLLPLLAAMPVVGMSLALVTSSPVVGLIGFASMGIGLALVVPTAFSAAGDATRGSANAGASIATVAALGWIGYVSGPPLIGHLAELAGLRPALIVLPVLAGVIALTISLTTAFSGPDAHKL